MSQRYAAALMRHMMRRKLKNQNRLVEAALAESAGMLSQNAASSVQMTETRVYVGLNDASARVQLRETEEYLAVLKDICRSHHAAFSVDIEKGGYYHEDGEYVEETSLVLVLIDEDRDTVQKIAQELRARFHQETVLVTEDRICGRYIGDEATE